MASGSSDDIETEQLYYKLLDSAAQSSGIEQEDLMSRQWVTAVIQKFEKAKCVLQNEEFDKLPPTVKEILVKYDVVNEDHRKMLMLKGKSPDDKSKKIIPLTETFSIVKQAHKFTNHGDVKTMTKWLSDVFVVVADICLECIVYTCEVCNSVSKAYPNVVRKFSTGLVNAIGMDTGRGKKKHDFNFLILYQDYDTGFLQLRPATSSGLVDSISNELTLIFSDFGPPGCIKVPLVLAGILKTVVNDRLNVFFNTQISIELCEISSYYAVTTIVKSALSKWMSRSPENKWCIGCYIVQYELNNTVDGTGKSPFEKVFKRKFAKEIKRSPETYVIPDTQEY